MGTATGVVCAQCAVGMALEHIEPHASRARVLIEVYRCPHCQLVERITRVETLSLRGRNDGQIDIEAPISIGTRATA